MSTKVFLASECIRGFVSFDDGAAIENSGRVVERGGALEEKEMNRGRESVNSK